MTLLIPSQMKVTDASYYIGSYLNGRPAPLKVTKIENAISYTVQITFRCIRAPQDGKPLLIRNISIGYPNRDLKGYELAFTKEDRWIYGYYNSVSLRFEDEGKYIKITEVDDVETSVRYIDPQNPGQLLKESELPQN